MERGKNPAFSTMTGNVSLFAAFLGGGGAANGTVPSNGVLKDDASTFPKGVNFGTSLTYVSTGLYTAVISQKIKNLLFANGIVVDAGASPTAALNCTVTKITPSTNTITVKIYTPAGVLTDLGTSDMLVLRIEGADTSVYP